MSSGLVSPSSLRNRAKYFLTINNTVWIYPRADIETVLQQTSLPVTFVDGSSIIVPSMTVFISLINEIYTQTVTTLLPQGYTIGVGTFLEDLGNEIEYKFPTGQVIAKYRLMRQMTDQTLLSSPGQSPNGTIGYVITYSSYDPDVYGPGGADKTLIVRIG